MDYADKLDGIYLAFRPDPLKIEDLQKFYVDGNKARGNQRFRKKIRRHLSLYPDAYNHILFIGYKGCGKSTELNFLQKELEEDNYLVINFSVRDELNPLDFSYIEFVISAMEQLFEKARDHNLSINQAYFDKINHWLADKEIVEVFEKYNISAGLDVGADANMGIPYFANLFAKFKMAAKSSKSLKETLKRTIEPKLADLIDNCNDLIREIDLSLRSKKKKGLILIVEDMDKIPRNVSSSLFFDYGATLRQLKANFIFTFPISLYHDGRFQTVDANFDSHNILPMIKVKNKDGTRYNTGIDILTEIVSKRMDLSIFANQMLLDRLILLSGGVLRDLFRLIREAAEFALNAERTIIHLDDIEDSINQLKGDYKNNIADNPENELTVEDYYEALINLANSPTKDPDNTIAALDLRQNLSILAYNGEGWYDLHPIIRIILEERGKIDKQDES